MRSADFVLVEGEALVSTFESSPGKTRCFCARCGSPLYSRRIDRPEVLRLRIGLLDTPISTRPTRHIFAASKAEWFDIHDDLPRDAGVEPGRG